MLFSKLYNNLISLWCVLSINIKIILFKKFLKKKIIFFYHPNTKLTKIHTFYLEYFFNKINNFKIFYVSKIYVNKNYYILNQFFLNKIYGVDIFFSNNICNSFTSNSIKVYIHHDIYDTPLVEKNKEPQLVKRLLKYDYIFIPSIKSKKLFQGLFTNSIKKPIIKILGQYLRLTFLLKNKIKKNSKISNNVIIAPTNFYSFPKLTMQNKITKIIELLINKKINVIYRPHPSNVNDKKIIKIAKKFEGNQFFNLDHTANYIASYYSSSLMITDMSGTAYTYAMLTGNPVIFLSVNEDYLYKLKYNLLNYFKDRTKIGLVATKPSLIVDYVKKAISKKSFFFKNITKIKKNFLVRNKLNLERYIRI